MTCEMTKDQEAEDLRAQLRTVETSLAGAQKELERLRADKEVQYGAFHAEMAAAERRRDEYARKWATAEHRLQQAREWVVRRRDALTELALALGEPNSDTSKSDLDTSADMSEQTLAGDGFIPGRRYWCKPEGCSHDDSRNPGHPERVREASEEFSETAGLPDTEDRESKALTDRQVALRQRAYEEGCDDTRAAIWEAVQEELQLHAWGPGCGPWDRLKKAIEGAAPAEAYEFRMCHWSPQGAHEAYIGGHLVRIVSEDAEALDLLARLFASKRVEIVVRETGELVKKVDAVRKEGLS
jgi:hypothetical protein